MEIFPTFLQEIYLEEKEKDVDYLGALIGVPLLTKILHFLTLTLSLSLSFSRQTIIWTLGSWERNKTEKDLYKAVDILDSPWP